MHRIAEPQFDFRQQPSLNKPLILELAKGQYLGVSPNALQVTIWATLRTALGDTAVSNLNMNQFLFKAPGFDADKDFDPIVRVGVNPMMIAVHPAVPVKDLKELVAYAKARPGKVSFATSGAKNIPHLVGETLNQVAQTDMLNIPYKGSQQASTDTIAGRTEVYIDAVPPMAPLIGADARLRPIAVTTVNRIAGHENVPTAKEQGMDLVMQGWMAFMAPAGMPAAVVERVAKDTNTVLARPEIVAKLRTLGTFELGGTTAALDSFIKEERAKWGRVVQAAKIERE